MHDSCSGSHYLTVNTISPSQVFWLESASGQNVPLHGHCSIGRSRTNTIPIACEKVSRRHALVHRDEEGQCLLIDLGSSNGTYVNGRRISHLSPVQTGDLIEIGSQRFTLRSGSRGKTTAKLKAEEASASGAQLVPCWILIGDKEEKDGGEAEKAAGLYDFKTAVHWTHVGQRIVERHHAALSDASDSKLFAYWPDADRQPAVASSVAKCLRELQAIQAKQRPSDFRLALHFGTVVIGSSGPRRQKSLIGAELTFTFHMQKLAWVLSTPCLISEEANRRLKAILPTKALEPCGLRGYEGTHCFFSL